MLKTFFFLFFSGFSFIALGASHPHKIVHPPIAQSKKQCHPMPAFNRINVKGTINVNLHTGYSQPQIILRGDPRDLAYVTTVVNHGTLYVTLGKGYPRYGVVQADIRGHYLNSFTYQGSGVIVGRHLQSSLLNLAITNNGRTVLNGKLGLCNVTLSGNGYVKIGEVFGQGLHLKIAGKTKVQLTGVINLTTLDIDKEGSLSLYWIKSKNLIVRGSGASFVQLAGVADKLDVELWGSTRFNGRYLRVNDLFVKTHDKTVAEISALNTQHTLASDSSDIRFFNIPIMRSDFMAFNGSVLDMREWSPFMQEYNRYNK